MAACAKLSNLLLFCLGKPGPLLLLLPKLVSNNFLGDLGRLLEGLPDPGRLWEGLLRGFFGLMFGSAREGIGAFMIDVRAGACLRTIG